MNTRDDIRAAAYENGWVQTGTHMQADEFQRDTVVDPSSRLGRLFAHTGNQARERVYVAYNGELDRPRLFTASYSGPGCQSVLTNAFVGIATELTGRNKRGQVIDRLTRPVDKYPTEEEN